MIGNGNGPWHVGGLGMSVPVAYNQGTLLGWFDPASAAAKPEENTKSKRGGVPGYGVAMIPLPKFQRSRDMIDSSKGTQAQIQTSIVVYLD